MKASDNVRRETVYKNKLNFFNDYAYLIFKQLLHTVACKFINKL